MNYPVRVVVPPSGLVVSLAEAKAHLRVEHDVDDALITALCTGVMQYLDGPTGILGRALLTQTLGMRMDSLPSSFDIPYPPAQEIVSITYRDLALATQTVSSSLYELRIEHFSARVSLVGQAVWPDAAGILDSIDVRWTAGYGNAAAVPEQIKIAMKLIIGHLYEQREEVSAEAMQRIPFGARALLDPLRPWNYA